MSVDSIQPASCRSATRGPVARAWPTRREAISKRCSAIDKEEPTARNWLGADALARTDARTAAMHFEIACKREPGERSHWINLAAAQRILGDAGARTGGARECARHRSNRPSRLDPHGGASRTIGGGDAAAERWNAVLALSASINDPSPEFVEILSHAKQYVGEAATEARGCSRPGVGRRIGRRPVRATGDECGRPPMPGLEGGRSTPTIAKACITRFCPPTNFSIAEHFPWLGELEAATEHNRGRAGERSSLTQSRDLRLIFRCRPECRRTNGRDWTSRSNWGAFHLWKEGERFDRRLCSRAAHRSLGGIASDLPHQGPGAQRLFLDPEGGQPYPGAHRGDQCAKRRPLAA